MRTFLMRVPCDPRGCISNTFEMPVVSPDHRVEREDTLGRYRQDMNRFMRKGYRLIEDGITEPSDWWDASRYYIAQEGKISARQ